MKFGICNEMFVNRPVTEVIPSIAKLGYHGIELAPFTLAEDLESFSTEAQRQIARCAADHGVEILGLHWLLAKPAGLHLTSPDRSVRSRTRDVFRKVIEIGSNTGGKILTLGSPSQRSFARGETQDIAVQRVLDFFQGLSPDLESTGVTVGLEPLETTLTNFMTRTAEACCIADAIGSPRVGITLDTHFVRWECAEFGATLKGTFDLVGKRLVHLHIQDDNLLAPGTGKADFSEYVAIVKGIGWRGYISVEAFGVAEEGRGEQIAADAMAFFREHFA